MKRHLHCFKRNGSLKHDEDCLVIMASLDLTMAGMYVTERSRELLRDVRLHRELNVRCCIALSYFCVH